MALTYFKFYSEICITYELRHKKNLSSWFTNIKVAYQPVYPHNLLSTFVIRYLGSIISKTCYRRNIHFLAYLCSLGEWFESRFVGNLKDRSSRDKAHINTCAFPDRKQHSINVKKYSIVGVCV